jgi:hypothetical protein
MWLQLAKELGMVTKMGGTKNNIKSKGENKHLSKNA